MNLSKAQIISGVVSNVIIILVISYFATGSLNPLEVFRGDNLLLKIVVGFFGVVLVLSIFAMLFRGGLADKRCAKCGLPLVEYAGSHGNPIRCNFCGRWFHTNCFKAEGGTILGGCKQEPCPTARTEEYRGF